jgi:Outer membrane receptor proteins, mostly Fe transport
MKKSKLLSFLQFKKGIALVLVLSFVSLAAMAQNITIKGKVTDSKGEAVINASIMVQGTTNGTVTDLDGNYSLTKVAPNAQLSFSYIGMKKQIVKVEGRTVINIVLVDDAEVLNEVVVTALGIKRQSRSLGYSTTKVGGEEFTLARDPNLGNALSGKVAGVSVAGNSTGPGGSSRVVIRGNASLTGNNMPLYVVDGVPFDNSNQGSAGTWGGLDMGDGLNNINADDVESIQVLKGAAASALYGYRGGNGAILITTKSGKKGKAMSVEVNNNLTFNAIYDQRDFQKVYGQGSDGQRPADKQAAIDSDRSNWGEAMDGGNAVNFLGQNYKYSYLDNFKKFYNTGVSNSSSIAISGSDEKVTYRFGVTNNYEKSILPNSNNSQIGMNMNTTYDIRKNLHFIMNANYVFEKSKGRSNLSDANGNTNAAILYHANSFDIRWMERGSETAQWGTTAAGKELLSGNSVYFNNPYWLQYRKTNDSRKNRLTGSMTLKWDITDWLYIQGATQRDGFNLEFKQVQPIGAAADPNGFMTEFQKTYYEMNYNFLLGFNKDFNDWSVGATFGGNKQINTSKTYYPTNGGRPFVVDGLWSVNNLDPSGARAQVDYSNYKVNSLYFTADLGWKKQLFLNITARRDWFSTLSKDNNGYTYPSVTGSWIFTDTFKTPEWFNFGKVRASWARASNGTSPYQNMMTFQVRNYKINGQYAVTANNDTYPNPLLKPVEISEKEIGLNLSFFQSRLNFDMAYYVKDTKDDIARVSISSTSGFSSRIMNIGKIQNKGFEFMVDGTPVKSENFMWNSTFNFALNDSKVKFLGDGVKRLAIEGATSNVGQVGVYNVLGSPYGEIIGYKYKRDTNGNLLLKDGMPQNNGEQVSLGNGVYKYTGGWQNTLKYKNITLAFLIDYKFGAKLFSGTNYSAYGAGLHKNTLLGRTADAPNQTYVFSGIDEATGQTNKTAVRASNYWGKITSENIAEEFTYDASFIKLRELSLGYEFPTSVLSKLKVVKSLNVSLVARNLWTIMKHTDNIDPEAAYNNSNGQGLELNGYPYSRNIGFNVNLKF